MLYDWINDVGKAATPDAVLSAMSAAMQSRDVAYYSHRTIISPAQTITHSTVPTEWIERYHDQRYFEFDPGIHKVDTARRPICMSFDTCHNTYHAEGVARKMFEEMKTFDANGSFFVPFRTSPGKPNASVNFLTDLRGPAFSEWVRTRGPSLELIATLAHSRMFGLVTAETDEDPDVLTGREKECLTWLAAGLRVDRIGDKMSISPRTVEFHLKNARKKLGAKTREQALAKAILRGLLDL